MWLLEATTWQAIEAARKAGMTPPADFMGAYTAGSVGDASRILSTVGDRAEVNIKGVLTAAPDWLSMLFGGGNTTYPEIIAAVASAEQDDSIKEIILSIDSPGGQIAGLFDALDAIKATTKPVKAVVSNMAASAAYAIASQADSIEATNRASRFGSVGILATFRVPENEVSIASTNAPDKNPDVTTEAGKAVVRDQLDSVHDIFVEAISEGRGATIEAINADYGQGGVLLAGDALTRGMIDSIAGKPAAGSPTKTTTTTASNGGGNLEAIMDLRKLQAEHPDVYAAAVDIGTNTERDRVGAHLKMGESSGDVKTASTAILDGSPMTQTLQAAYMTAGMNRMDATARSADDDQAAAAADNVNDSESPDVDADAEAIAGALEARHGVKGGEAHV